MGRANGTNHSNKNNNNNNNRIAEKKNFACCSGMFDIFSFLVDSFFCLEYIDLTYVLTALSFPRSVVQHG